MANIVLNGDKTQVDDNASIDQLLRQLDLSDKRLAVEINQQIIPRSEFASYIFSEDDKVEIVQAIGGGSH